jgi:hypothetical protein
MGIVGIRQRNIIDAQVRQQVAALDDLRAINNAAVGDIVQVMGYSSAGDGGGGLFKLIQVNDFVSGATVSSGATTANRTLTVNWPYGIEREQPLINHNGDQIQWTGGAVWTKNNQWAGPGESSSGSTGWTGDASTAVANNEKGYLIPKVEGFRVIPTYAGWNRTTIWERIVEDGTVTPEMFGAKISDRLGVRGSGTDCTTAIQAALDSPFNVRFGGGNYFISAAVYVKTPKTITGVGYDNVNPDQARQPTKLSDLSLTRIWTDRNTNFFNIQACTHIEKIQFNLEYTALGEYDKTILNYDMSFPNWGSSVWFCSFVGNRSTTTGYAGKGGTAIRFNSDEADNTFVRRNNAINIHGYVSNWSSRKIHIQWMATGHKIDPIKSAATSAQTGLSITTWTNCTELDATFNGVKQAVRWEGGSICRISGEYFQDGPCLPYAERETPIFYLHGGDTIIDIGIGDQRFTVPAENDDVLLGGSVSYPSEHYVGYNYDTNGRVTYEGRALRDYAAGYSQRLATPAYSVDNAPLISADSLTGHNFASKDGVRPSLVTSWIDNQLLFADLRSTVTVNALRSTASYDFDAATDELGGTFSAATGVTASNMSDLWTMTGTSHPTIDFGAGSDADNDFVEIVLQNATGSPNFINRAVEFLARMQIGCKRLQFIIRTAAGVTTKYLIDTSVSSGETKAFRLPITQNNSYNKVIIRFIGSTGANTQIFNLHMNCRYFPTYPFLPASGGTLLGALTVPSLAFSSGSGFAPPAKQKVTAISSADLLTGNSGGIRSVITGDWINIRGIYYEVTSGTTNYATNTNLEFFQGSRFYPFFSIDLSALIDNGRRRMIPVATGNLQYAAGGISWQVQTGDPTTGNKAIRVVIDYTTGQPTS